MIDPKIIANTKKNTPFDIISQMQLYKRVISIKKVLLTIQCMHVARDFIPDCEFRKGDAARPVGEGKYVMVRYRKHAELAYILEMPEQPGEAPKRIRAQSVPYHELT
jgi:hypothetical protein